MGQTYQEIYGAEQSVIGCLLTDPSALGEIYEKLKPEMFRIKIFREMYLEFLRAYACHQAMDIILMTEKMKEYRYRPDEISSLLKECMSQAVTSVFIRQYAQCIIDTYKTAELQKLMQTVQASSDGIHAKMVQMMNGLEALLEDKCATGKKLSVIVQENRKQYFCPKEKSALQTGFAKLDNSIMLKGGDMIVLGARPGVGKSAFVTQMALNFSRQGKRVGFFNLEMQDDQVYERFVSSLSGIGLTRLQRAECYLGDEEERFRKANEYLSRQEIVISTGSKSVSQIRSESRYMDYDVIIIDYIQLIRADVRYQSRASEVGAVSKAIKALAMELKVPVIALSQLNRVSEMKQTKEPTMAELREAGDIEQDASIIILMWNLTEDRKKKGLKVDKNRQGEYGKMALRFNGNLMQFEETEEPMEEPSGWSKTRTTPFD